MARALTPEPETRMSREEFRNWGQQQPSNRFERIEGVVIAMAPERAAHNRLKKRTCNMLDAAVRRAGLACEVFADGMTVEVGDSDYEPDAILRCGEPWLADDATAVPDPMVIVEVLSPTTSSVDRGLKRRDYFLLPSVQHYAERRNNLPRADAGIARAPSGGGLLRRGAWQET